MKSDRAQGEEDSFLQSNSWAWTRSKIQVAVPHRKKIRETEKNVNVLSSLLKKLSLEKMMGCHR